MTTLRAPAITYPHAGLRYHIDERVSRWCLFSLCVLTALAGRLCYLGRPFDSDGAMFIYQGRLISQGGRIGRELIDNKFPTVGLMTSAAWRAFGASWPCYVLLGAALSAAAAGMLARTARRSFGEHAAAPTALFGIVFLNLAPAVFGGFQLETIQSFFCGLAACAAMEAINTRDRRDAFLIGLAAGCAAMLKPTGLAVVVAFFAAVIWTGGVRAALRFLAPVILGLALPGALVLAYLIGADNLRDMPALAAQISRYASNSAWDAADLLKPLTVAGILGFPFLVRGWIFRRERLPESGLRNDRAAAMFVGLWLLLECGGVIAQRRMYAYHFLVLAAPAALVFGMIRRRDTGGSLAAALAPTILLSLVGAYNVVTYSRVRSPRLAVSDYLAVRTSVGDIVWRDDAPRLLLETNLRSGSRHVLMFIFANWDTAPREYATQLLEDFDQARPRYLVLPADVERHAERMGRNMRELAAFPQRRANFSEAWRRIDLYAREYYLEETTIGDETVWRRR